jgi:ketosteroid isomerase-like protein
VATIPGRLENTKAEIAETLQDLAAAVNAGNLERYCELWHPDARVFAPNAPAAIGRHNVLFQAKERFQDWDHDLVLRCDEIHVTDAWAFASGRLTLLSVSRRDGRAEPLSGTFLVVLANSRCNGWLIYRGCYNSATPLAGSR